MYQEKFLKLMLSDLIPDGIYKRNHFLYSINTLFVMFNFALKSNQVELAEILISRIQEEIKQLTPDKENYSFYIKEIKTYISDYQNQKMDKCENYKIKIAFDAGSGTCLWADSEITKQKYSYAIEIEKIPISENLKYKLKYLVAYYDTLVDWNYPIETNWTSSEKDNFERVKNETVEELKVELNNWEICLTTSSSR